MTTEGPRQEPPGPSGIGRKAGILFMLQKVGGFGMIALDGGAEQVFLLHADLPPGLFDTLRQGDRLEFDATQDSKGLRATNVKRVRNLEEEIRVTETDQIPGSGGAFKIRITKKKPKPKRKKKK
jgi:cold shock CspA family protein